MSVVTAAKPVTKVVIVGGGTAGWMTAAALSRTIGHLPGMDIQLIESDAIGTIGVGEATIPQILIYNQMIGIDEAEFIRETRATFKLGIEFVDWRRIGDSYIHPFGSYGVDMEGIEFHHFWLRARQLGLTTALEDYSIGAVAARAGKFMPPQPQNPNSPLARMAYAFQFDAGRYARYLRSRAEAQAVVRTEGRIIEVIRNGESGHVEAVMLENGSRIEGELFIDCSGFRSLLLGEAMEVAFEDWSKWLPCDRAIAVPCLHKPGRDGGNDSPYTRSTARPAGWQWRIPLQHRVGNGHVYSSAHMSDDAALDLLLANLDGSPMAEPNRIRFQAGHRKQAWSKNVVAIGLAGGFLEPLESTAIHLVQSGIARLLTLWPHTGFSQPEINRFNSDSAQEYLDIRDFLVLHYKATERDDSEFWRYCRNLPPPDGLAAKLEMYRSSGRIFREHEELFTETSWLAVMEGQGIAANGWHPVAHTVPAAELMNRMRDIQGIIAQNVSNMPSQAQFLRDNGALAIED